MVDTLFRVPMFISSRFEIHRAAVTVLIYALIGWRARSHCHCTISINEYGKIVKAKEKGYSHNTATTENAE